MKTLPKKKAINLKTQFFGFLQSLMNLDFLRAAFIRHHFHILGISGPILKYDYSKWGTFNFMKIEQVYGALILTSPTCLYVSLKFHIFS